MAVADRQPSQKPSSPPKERALSYHVSVEARPTSLTVRVAMRWPRVTDLGRGGFGIFFPRRWACTFGRGASPLPLASVPRRFRPPGCFPPNLASAERLMSGLKARLCF